MENQKLRERVEALIAALEAADVTTLTITLNDVTPEQVVAAYTKVAIETFVVRYADGTARAIDSAKIPRPYSIEASHHREPTAEELAVVDGEPPDAPVQTHIYGGAS